MGGEEEPHAIADLQVGEAAGYPSGACHDETRTSPDWLCRNRRVSAHPVCEGNPRLKPAPSPCAGPLQPSQPIPARRRYVVRYVFLPTAVASSARLADPDFEMARST